jgi:hypothetical protein
MMGFTGNISDFRIDAVAVARSENRPHSLISSHRTWQILTVAALPCDELGVALWGYAYENDQFDRRVAA